MRATKRIAAALLVAAVALPVTSEALGQPPDRSDPRARFERNRAASGGTATPSPRPTASSTLPERDQGILNEMHRAHVGQVVFTREDLTVHAIDERALVDRFDLGEAIFFRVYMDRSAVNAMMGRPGVSSDRAEVASAIQYRARFDVDGRTIETTFHPFGTDEERNTYTTWRGKLLSPRPVPAALPGAEVLRELLARGTSAGLFRAGATHRITMQVVAMANPPQGRAGDPIVGPVVAQGGFTMRVPEGVIHRDNPDVCVPAGPSEPEIERAILAQARPAWLARDAQPVGARTSFASWEVERHPVTGIPLERSTDVWVLARGAEACYAAPYHWAEPFAGNGFSTSSGELSFRPFLRTYVPCSCLE